MYECLKQIEDKIKQVKYVYSTIKKFENRIFENNGIDSETGAHSLKTHVSSFLAHSRSIIQYAHKEAKRSNNLKKFDQYVKNIGIFKFFKGLRNSDIHEYTIGSYTNIEVDACMEMALVEGEPNKLVSQKFTLVIERLLELDSPKNNKNTAKVTYTICRKVEVTEKLMNELKEDGRVDLISSIQKGNGISAVQNFKNIKDLHQLCEMYILELENFIAYGKAQKFIT